MSIDAMKQALAAIEAMLESINSPSLRQIPFDKNVQAMVALRAAIEQAQGKHEDWCASLTQLLLSMPPKPAPCNCKSKTASPRRWQKLTDEEIVLICGECAASHADDLRYARAIEAKLKEKNT